MAGTDEPYPDVRMPIVRALEGHATVVADMELRRDGSAVPIEVWAGPVFDEAGRIDHAIAAFQDISARRQTEEELRHAAFHDPLTDLANRSLFEQHLIQAGARARRNNSMFAVAFIDLDGFKLVNDALGHNAGDALLKVVGERMQSCLRGDDTLGRFGGDEFAAFLLDADLTQGLIAAERIRSTIEQYPFSIVKQGRKDTHSITMSLGVSSFPEDSADPIELVEMADSALYRSKREGRNRVSAYRDVTADDLKIKVPARRS